MQTQKSFKFVLFLTLGLALVACGSDDDGGGSGGSSNNGGSGNSGGSTNNGGNAGSQGGTDLECGGDVCDTSSEYCIISEVGGVVSASLCAPRPSGCESCDCATDDVQDAWEKANPGTNNCSGATLLCGRSDAAIEVTCQR
ncbi:MAG: hypothetical protein KC492_25350 [Myxococcales bacterium]|nr:hypothetical protein [Myxococcales bacterium]